MPQITYIEHDGTEHTVDVEDGFNVMEGATLNMVPGIEGVCGGMCACATCHCFIKADDAEKYGLAAPDDGELEMLNNASERQETSRLGCQIDLDASHEGLRVYMPSAQSQ